ncbi:multidrug ABC transporter permease [Actinomadura sp. CNU-125]|uniref:ABC transporter ATP-binding protein n=1 Tax=Actinomadura sp. CNU-125 TaxID=1904961 RepID=UPI00095B31AC|nr:ABC transporter ATP-binding protein [Actinomadura sp. CNU-125]OLT19618.1 multidrug ABC transporter permease [Actinomadura sp. CNU-125]
MTGDDDGTDDTGQRDGGVRVRAAGVLRALGLAWTAGRLLTVCFAAGALAEAAVPVVVAWLTKFALDAVAERTASTAQVVQIAAGLAAAGIAAATLPHLSRYVRSELERRIGLLTQDQLFRAAERFAGLARFEDPVFLDRLSLAHQSGGSTPSQVVGGTLAIGRGAVTVLGFVASLLLISPWLTAAVILAAVPALLAELRLSRQRAAMMWRLGPVERRELFYRQVLTDVKAAKELRLFGTGPYFRGLMNRERRASNRERGRMDRRELAVQSVLALLSAAIAGGGLVWALLAARTGALTPGDVALLVTSVAGVQAAVSALVNEVTLAHQELLLFDHYLAVIEAEPDIPVAADPVPVPPLRRGVEFRDVWFRYSPDHPWALRGVTLTIPHGRATALVGRNGAGKSTLVKLLCRMYDPERGAVLWDGVDLRDLDPAELRDRVGAVFQDYMEYDVSAAHNIGLGDLPALDDRERIEAAARRAGVHATVTALPDGYDTMLSRLFFDAGPDGEADPTAGVVLSGGQWQRLALARAMLRDGRDLLVLDEPSSGLDAEAEHEIHTGLRAHRAGRTSVLISHRLGAIRDADLLVVLDEGRVAEEGTHAELLRRDGVYARLFTLQAQGYGAGAPDAATAGRRSAEVVP